MAGRRHSAHGRRLAAIGDLTHHAALHQRQRPSRHPLAIERGAGLQRVKRIVADRDIVPEDLLPDAVVQKAATIARIAVALKSANIWPVRSSTAAGSRITGATARRQFAWRPGFGARGLPRRPPRQRHRVQIGVMARALALAQPEQSVPMAVMEKRAIVSR